MAERNIIAEHTQNAERPAYYAIIPASVRYDKRVTPNAKLLYGEITALCNERGYCWANNEYFANLYGVSKGSISSWIGQLARAKYISLEMIYREGSKEILHRYIRLFDDPIPEILNTPIPEILKDNITVFNNTINNTYNKDTPDKPAKRVTFQKPTLEQVREYCKERENKIDPEQWIDHYEANGWMVGKTKMKDWKATVRNWERNNFESKGKQGYNKPLPIHNQETMLDLED